MIEIDPRDFRVVSRSFDGGGRYVAAVSADGALLFRAILGRDDHFSEGWIERLVEVEKPADLDWAEWTIVPGYGSTPDFADVDLVLLDGKTHRAEYAEDVYLVGVEEGEPVVFAERVERVERVEVADLATGDLLQYLSGDEVVRGRVVSVGPVDKYPHLAGIAVESGHEMLAPYAETVEVVR